MDGSNQKILIANENLDDLKKLQTILSNANFQVIPVTKGLDAVEAFKSHKPDIVILNIDFADEPGYEVAKEIASLIVDQFIPIIFIAESTDENVAFCYEVGDEVIIKPFNPKRILGKLKALNRAERRNFLTRAERDELASYHRNVLQEQEIAKKIFDSIAHIGCMSDKDIRYQISPMALFNGDVVLADKNPVGDLYLFIGDFTGHGLAAAMGAIPISEIFYGMVQKGFELNKLLAKINEKLKAVLPSNIFCACACLIFNMRNHTLTVFSAGFPPILVKRQDPTKQDLILYSKNLPLGILAPSAFDIDMNTYELADGDRVILYTDGLTEAKNQKKEIFGSKRLQELFVNNQEPKYLYDDILKALSIFNEGVGYSDDFTIVEITASTPEHKPQETPPKENTGEIVCYHGSVELDWEVEFTFGPKTLRYQNALPVIMHWINEYPVLKQDYQSLYNIIEELYMNALDHGILKIEHNILQTEGLDLNKLRQEQLSKIETCFIKVKIKIVSESGLSSIVIHIEDSGDGFEHEKMLEKLHKQQLTYGGLQRILPYCHSITYNQKGNAVTVIYRTCI